jgi:hypothetical protein
LSIKCVSWFSLQRLSERFITLKRYERDMYIGLFNYTHQNTHVKLHTKLHTYLFLLYTCGPQALRILSKLSAPHKRLNRPDLTQIISCFQTKLLQPLVIPFVKVDIFPLPRCHLLDRANNSLRTACAQLAIGVARLRGEAFVLLEPWDRHFNLLAPELFF